MAKAIETLKRVHPKYGILCRIGFETGLRISDILALKSKTINSGYFHVTEKKTQKRRKITLNKTTLAEIDKYAKQFRLKENDFLVYGRERSKPLSRIQAYRVIKKNLRGMGNLGTHTFRKTYALMHYRKYGDIKKLSKELNHKYLSTTLGYLINIQELKLPI